MALTDAHLLRVSLPYYNYYHQHVKDSSTNNNINWNYSFGNVPRLRLIKAVAAAPASVNPPGEIVFDLSEEDEEAVDEREQLRRLRISKANKGNTPWNKGRNHTPETLQKIKERTRLAMQNPKVQVKLKLSNLGRSKTHSTEIKLKIGAGMRKLWEKRREMKMVQENWFFEWQNLIAEASRQGFVGQEELQWDSYEILDEQLKQEWSVSLKERRKQMARRPSYKRAPKSLEQRRKIAEAIAAKWTDPVYRAKVCSGLAKSLYQKRLPSQVAEQ